MSYQRLIEEHDHLEQLSRQLLALAMASKPDVQAACELLFALAGAVSDHLTHEDHLVYSQLIRGRVIGPTQKAIDFEDAFEVLRADWQIYLAEWTAETLACDWSTFRDETTAMLTRLRCRMAEETDLIYRLALQQGYIRLRTKPSESNLEAAIYR